MTETTPPNPDPGHLDPGDAEPVPPAEPTEPIQEVPPMPVPEPLAARQPAQGHRPARVLTAVGFLLLAGGLLYVWLQQQPLMQAPGIDAARIAALEGQARNLQQRVAQLEQRPLPQAAPPPSAPPAAPTVASPPPPPDLRPLEARIAALEQRPPAVTASPPDLAPLVGRLDALDRRVAQVATQAATDAGTATNRADRAIRIEAAAAALAAGQPLGNLPDAPAPLARFATAKPPTEAELRLAFPAAANRAAEASRPAVASQSMADRMWQRIASVVTVRSGDRVILGTAAGPVLDAARERLDAGDLTGAVAALDGLDPGAAQAMADWRARAQSLLDARAALAALAAN